MIYIDRFNIGGHIYSHMISDSSIEELHKFAQNIGLSRSWFHNKKNRQHYDLTSEQKIQNAIQYGAIEITSKEIIKILKRKETDA